MTVHRYPRRYTEWDEEIVQLYEAGWSLRQISRRIHWSPNFVRYHLIKSGVKLRKRGGQLRDMDPVKVRKACTLYKLGYSMEDVARIMGVSRTGVRGWLMRGGTEIRPRGTAGRQQVTRRVA